MNRNSIKRYREWEVTEKVEILIPDRDHMMGLRRTRIVREATQEIEYSECSERHSGKESWKERLMAVLASGLRIVPALRDLIFCKPTSVLGENIDGTLVPRGTIGCLRRTPSEFKNWSTLPTVWVGLCPN